MDLRQNVEQTVSLPYIQSVTALGDYKLQKWKEAGLPKISMVRMKFATIDKAIIIKIIGELEDVDREKIEENILSFFKS